MTSDAKIGLLLGLVFIIIIAFLINGLPSYLKSASADDVINTSVTGFEHDSFGINKQASEAVKVIHEIDERYQRPLRAKAVDGDYSDVRYTIELPAELSEPVFQRKKLSSKSVRRAVVESYVVQPGDNLAVIAKKVYGSQLGNKRAVVQGIYQANASRLDSPDKIRLGQELVIPLLSSVSTNNTNLSKKKSISLGGMFEKVSRSLKKSVGRRKAVEYVVTSGDNLWQISTRFLGDGSRYHEIVKLNSNILDNSYDLAVNMKLTLPYR